MVVGTKKATGQRVRSNARRSDTWWLRDVARFGSPRATLPRVSARSSNIESWPLVLGGVVACALVAHELLLPLAGSSLTIHFADRVSSRE